MGKKNNLMPFVLGAAAGAVLTWLLTSEEGKKVAKNWEAKASDFLEDLIGNENDSSMVEENKTKTETNGN
jgi:hypothetical protein